MIDGNHELDRLAGQLFQKGLMPDIQPEVIASLVAWLQSSLGTDSAGEGGAHAPSSCCPLSKDGNLDNDSCRRMRPASDENQSTVCALLDGNRPNWHCIIDLFMHRRALGGFADHAASWAHPSHVAAFVLTQNARILDCDYRAQSFLKAGNVLHMLGGQLYCTDAKFQPNFNSALKETAGNGRTANILLHPPEQPDKRFSLTLTRMPPRPPVAKAGESAKIPDILCLVAPLDGRRIATARQLMDFFQLSAAEARLARAICHGDSVEEYARDQGLRLPTVRTQLSSIFNKTGTERQAGLVRLIAGIPVVRDSA